MLRLRQYLHVLIAFLSCCAYLVVQGCAGDLRVVKDTVGILFRGGIQDLTLGQVLNPNYRYLRVTVDGRSVLLVMGYVEADSTQVWYSGQGEVLRLRAGRIVGAIGMPVEWVSVRYVGDPVWSGQDRLQYQRIRDLKERYQYGVKEQVVVQKLEPPTGHRLEGSPNSKQDLTWYSERYDPSGLPSSIFAVRHAPAAAGTGAGDVVYSWQCISPSYCLQLQSWTLSDHAAIKALAAQSNQQAAKN